LIYVLIVLVIALGALTLLAMMLVYQLILQNGRILARIEMFEGLLAPLSDHQFGIEEYVATLPAGVPAPPFSLPDLGGVQRTLSEWRGSRVLLVFFDPNCAFSRELLPRLAALGDDVVPGRPIPVVVTTGDRETNQTLFEEAGFSNPVLLQRAAEVSGNYKVDGTPMAYLVNADGTIASDIAVGIQSILILAGEMAVVTDATNTAPTALTIDAPPLEMTARVRDGLPEGDPAPVFRLRRLDGGEVSLLEYRGKNLVVVFSDPDCVPCDELAPQLETAHREYPELSLLMISRGRPEDTQAKAAEFGLTFPIALQRHWEISREYGIFVAPAAFFIDEWGTIGADVAVGPDNVMQLIRGLAGNRSR
jgi:peroxiredoxin